MGADGVGCGNGAYEAPLNTIFLFFYPKTRRRKGGLRQLVGKDPMYLSWAKDLFLY